jgi:hypothetical protein
MKRVEDTFTFAEMTSADTAARPLQRATWRLEHRTLALVALAVTFAAGVFAAHYALERQLSELHAFKQYDVLFDTDPVVRLVGFSHGWGPYNRNFLHPNLANFINPPLRAVAKGLQLAGLGGSDPLALREALGLMVNPLFSALQALAALALFLRLGFSRPAAFLLALLGAGAFSQIVFGSIPDHFALSGFFLTLIFIVAADLLQRQGEILWPAWLFVGWLIASITVSNLAILGLVFWVSLRFCRRPQATRKTLLLMLATAALTFATYSLLNLGYEAEPQPPRKSFSWTLYFLRPDAIANLLRFPTAVADSIAPPEPEVTNIRYLNPVDARFEFQFTLAETPLIFTGDNWLGTLVFLLLVAGALGHYRAGGSRRGLLWCGLAVLAFNGLFHSVWGHEYFLYSQHWLIAAVFLAAGVFSQRPRLGPAVFVLVTLLTATVLLNNFLNIRLLLQTLAAAPVTHVTWGALPFL